MRLFSCSACKQMVFFENFACTNCGHALAFLPDLGIVTSLERADGSTEPAAADTIFVALAAGAKGTRHRLCKNGIEHQLCNWLVREDDAEPLCRACRLNAAVPNLGSPEAVSAWRHLEAAKRRLLYSLLELGLPVESRVERPENGLAFAFMADGDDGQEKVYTGHADGLITINIAEADDPFREKVRKDMGEAYRTLLGHFRHEVGHYYWDRLVRDTPWLERFRALFGDETFDYGQAVKRHYEQGSPPGWELNYVSAYATMHPWEDWAETWAHYLHMVDTLGTARAYGVSLKAKAEGRSAEPTVSARKLDFDDFDDLLSGWIPLTLALNGLNRSMGFHDPYPFVLTDTTIKKLRFVHDVVENWNAVPSTLSKVLAVWPERDTSQTAESSAGKSAMSDAPEPLAPAGGAGPAPAPPAGGTAHDAVNTAATGANAKPATANNPPVAE